MKILLLGGTGAIGKDLADILSKDKQEVVVTTRSNRKSQNNLKYMTGNALDEAFLKDILKDKFDIIVDFMMYYDIKQFKNRIDLLLEHTDNYIFISSSRVYANCDELITEQCPTLLEVIKDKMYIKNNDYAILKCKEEELLNKSKNKNYTIIRPYITYNNEKLQLGIYEKEKWLFRALEGRTVVFSKELLEKKTTLSFGQDVAKQIANICYNAEAIGETYQITTAKSVSWREVLEVYANTFKKVTGKQMKIKLVDNLYNTKILKPNYQYEYDRKFNREFNSKKVYEVTKIFNGQEIDTALSDCLANFLQEPKFFSIDWKDEAIKDKICKEKTNIKKIANIKDKIFYITYRYFPINYIENFLRKIKRMINYLRN